MMAENPFNFGTIITDPTQFIGDGWISTSLSPFFDLGATGERLRNPHPWSFRGVAENFHLAYVCPSSTASFVAAYEEAQTQQRSTLFEIVVDGEASVRLFQAASTAVGSAHVASCRAMPSAQVSISIRHPRRFLVPIAHRAPACLSRRHAVCFPCWSSNACMGSPGVRLRRTVRMADDYAEHLRQHDEILRSLAAMPAMQHEKNQAYDTIIQEQREMNQRLTLAIERIDRTLAHVEITQARMETLLARMMRHEDNGQDA
jgi:hypothetical protein